MAACGVSPTAVRLYKVSGTPFAQTLRLSHLRCVVQEERLDRPLYWLHIALLMFDGQCSASTSTPTSRCLARWLLPATPTTICTSIRTPFHARPSRLSTCSPMTTTSFHRASASRPSRQEPWCRSRPRVRTLCNGSRDARVQQAGKASRKSCTMCARTLTRRHKCRPRHTSWPTRDPTRSRPSRSSCRRGNRPPRLGARG